uniref:Dual oxidase 2 n=1 Tax=Kryptolebias marmoratus TaxID=37003 RepID=A0A3Q3BI44_KRYMA
MTFYDDIYPFYPPQRTSFIVSGRLLTISLVFLVLAVSLLLILPGIRGRTVSRLFWMFRIITSLFIGVVLARMTTNATYKSFSNAVINAEVGLHVGLYGINVTLRGNPVVQFNETINYNEMFSWHGAIEEEYEDALERGLPNPILYIVEKFTLSSPCGLIFQYRYSGRFASATLWTAFCCWVLANILFAMPVILYAGYMMMATAAFVFFSMVSFSTIMNVPRCVFAIGADSFVTEFSHSFWLALATGERVRRGFSSCGETFSFYCFASPSDATSRCAVRCRSERPGRERISGDAVVSPPGGWRGGGGRPRELWVYLRCRSGR